MIWIRSTISDNEDPMSVIFHLNGPFMWTSVDTSGGRGKEGEVDRRMVLSVFVLCKQRVWNTVSMKQCGPCKRLPSTQSQVPTDYLRETRQDLHFADTVLTRFQED